MKKSVLIAVCIVTLVLTVIPHASMAQGKIIYTTLDLKQDYEVIMIISANEDIIGSSGLKLSSVEKAEKAAWEKFMAIAGQLGADAVVGVRINLENMNSNTVGRLMIYGTAVRFKKQ